MLRRLISISVIFAFVFTMVFTAFTLKAEAAFTNFITRSVDKLMDGAQEFRFISFNTDQLLKKFDLSVPDPSEQEDAMRTISQMGGQVVRCYAISVGSSNSHVTAPNTFSEDYFKGTDKLLQLANQYGIRLIMVLVDNYNFHVGGISTYEAFRGQPSGSFYTNAQIKQDFKDTINYVVNRVNSYTGVRYKDDKAILAWETGNELQPPDSWTSEIAAYIKSVDPNHLIMDGKFGISSASLTNNNIDIVSNHYYPISVGQDYATACNNDRNTSRGYKAFIAGEFGEFAGSTLTSWSTTVTNFLNALISNGTTGTMAWALRTHGKSGGFLIHPNDNLQNLRWPGFPSGDSWQETTKMTTIRNFAYQIRGLSVPAREIAPAPVLLPISSVSSIGWIGSAGAEKYDVERATSTGGPWTVVGTDVLDSMIPYQPFNDTSAVGGQSYYYRVKAKNVAGVSLPSNVVGPVTVTVSELLTNPGFESGTSSWFAFGGGSITADSANKRTGTYGLKDSGRQGTWYGPGQNITSALQANGQGNYTLTGWMKLASGTDSASLATIQIIDGSGTRYISSSPVAINSSGWTQVGGTINVTWSGTLSQATVYYQTGSTLVDTYLDDSSLTKPATNLVQNPGFENGSTSWVLDAGWSISTADKYSGTSSARLDGTSSWRNLYQTITVTPNTNYTLTFYGKCSNSTYFDVRDGSWATALASGNTAGNNVWTQYTLNFNSGSYSSVVIRVGDNNNGTNYFDDFDVR